MRRKEEWVQQGYWKGLSITSFTTFLIYTIWILIGKALDNFTWSDVFSIGWVNLVFLVLGVFYMNKVKDKKGGTN